MRWIFDQQPYAFAVFDLDGRVLSANEVMLRATALSMEETRGRRLTEFLQGHAFEETEQRILRVAETGEPELLEHYVRLPGEDKAHAWAVDIFPLKGAMGRVQAVGLFASDYSQQYGTRERLALMSEARTRIGGSLDIGGTVQELAEVVVPRFADSVSVDLLESVFRGETPPVRVGGHPVLRRAGDRGPNDRSALSGLGDREAHIDPGALPVAECLGGRTVMREENGTSFIAVPIRTPDAVLGIAVFVRSEKSREPFGPDDVAVTEDLVARLAVCLDNARRFTRERGIALALQRAMLPRRPAALAAVETVSRYLPAGNGSRTGGDWFDVIPLPGARVGLVIGDVVGHGIAASATMGRLRTAVRTLADIDLSPDELLTHLDDIVTHTDEEQDFDADDVIPGEIGATCLYAVYDPVSGTCSMARAGHLAPVLVLPDGSGRVVDLPTGPPPGLGSLPFEAVDLDIPDGSVLALFTDGLVTSRECDFDEDLSDLQRALAQPARSLDALCDSVLASMCTQPRTDDVALLLARTKRLSEDQVADWAVPPDPAAVATIRREVVDRLAAWHLDAAAFVAELAVSELVTNAIRYGTEPIRLRLIRERSLICEVSDGSSTSPHLRRARTFDEGGRGLFMIAQLARRWGTRYSMTGKTIWAEQQLDELIP
jgi:PAS domain S-box-containing protein